MLALAGVGRRHLGSAVVGDLDGERIELAVLLDEGLRGGQGVIRKRVEVVLNGLRRVVSP